MKVKRMLAVFSLLMMVGLLRAAENPTQNTEDIERAAMRANKKALVAKNLVLTPEQETSFWPMYDEFQIAINNLNADREAVVKKFAINYNSMTDELAKELLDKVTDIEKKRIELKKTLISNFSKKFPMKLVARYYQIENKVDAMITGEAASQIPLIK